MIRLFDMLISFILIILFSPIFCLLTLIIWFDLRTNVFFIQERPGLNGTIFKLIKFKTMVDIDYKNKLSDDKRLTSFGRWLRTTSMDELPEFFNVLKGDMSLVGPRPLLKKYLPLYTERQMKRHQVLPGITGWAQINGRNLISWEEKFEMDIWYVENKTFFLNIKILILTLKKIILREGISHNDSSTMPEFTGKE